MSYWKLTPVADPEDGRWQDSDMWAEVVVEAESPGQARLVAARLDTNDLPETVQPNDPFVLSRFADEKLYRVTRIDGVDLPEEAAAAARDAEPPPGGRVLSQHKRGAGG